MLATIDKTVIDNTPISVRTDQMPNTEVTPYWSPECVEMTKYLWVPKGFSCLQSVGTGSWFTLSRELNPNPTYQPIGSSKEWKCRQCQTIWDRDIGGARGIFLRALVDTPWLRDSVACIPGGSL